jgi:hypothetical protein
LFFDWANTNHQFPVNYFSSNCAPRYELLEIADVPKDFLFKSENALSMEEFNRLTEQYPKRTLVVPIVEGSLRVKLVSQEEWLALDPPTIKSDRFEHGGFHYQFSVEQESLCATPGVLVSMWKKHDDTATGAKRVTYDFCISLFEVYKYGFGARDRADCGGLNVYRACTNSMRAHPSPGVGPSQISEQQYYRQEHAFPLIQALIEKCLHHQTRHIVGSARKSNPPLVDLLGDYCEKAIITCGARTCQEKNRSTNMLHVLTMKKSIQH